jgi:hypothetical protein
LCRIHVLCMPSFFLSHNYYFTFVFCITCFAVQIFILKSISFLVVVVTMEDCSSEHFVLDDTLVWEWNIGIRFVKKLLFLPVRPPDAECTGIMLRWFKHNPQFGKEDYVELWTLYGFNAVRNVLIMWHKITLKYVWEIVDVNSFLSVIVI